ncbi:hypothetical protein Tco_0701860 [Tanacetum coccineum]|uniref:Uncharacterized protein n=1 Tax=Tanacetum coccineum TaxID=301880 RepID=A0ABQ4XUE0_9ASTR
MGLSIHDSNRREVQITATIDGHSKTITEASLRRHLKLDDHDNITSIPNSKIFEQLALMGYHTDSDKLTFQKGDFSPQWSFIPISTQPSLGAEQHIPTPNESPLHVGHSHGSVEGSLKLNELTSLVTKLSEKIGVLEDDLKKTKLTYSAAVTKLILRGRKLSDEEVQEKASTETKLIIQEVTPTEVIQDQGSSEKGNSKVSTAGATKEKATRKDQGEKRIMTEAEPKKKLRKSFNKKELSFVKPLDCKNKLVCRTKGTKISRDKENARQWTKRKAKSMSESKSSKKIDWNDPSVIRYHALKMKPKTVAQARRNMVKYLKNQGNYKIKHGSERMKSPEKIEEEDVDTQKEMKEVSKESGAKIKKSLPKKSTRSTVKRQKMELDDEKEYLKGYLDIVPREDVAKDVESLSTKYLIVDWKTYTLSENFMYYNIIRGDGSSKNYKILSEMLYDFDRQDIMELYRLIKERKEVSSKSRNDIKDAESNGVGDTRTMLLAMFPGSNSGMLSYGLIERRSMLSTSRFEDPDHPDKDVKSASTPTDLEKPLVQDGDAADVDEHLYISMIGSLMYLTASRPDIMFAVCACARFQVSPKTSHLLAVKRIFRYLKGKPSLGLWYSKDSPLELVAYTDSDYAGATQDRKSTTRGCQFLGNRLISWQCKKQTVVATSTTKAEYVAAASCCGQVLYIQNQMLDYGYNFMNTVIYIDNNSTICIIENPVQHSKTKHIEIRHHFIRDCNAKKLIQMAKIDTEHNVADLLTKGFDARRFQYLVSRSEGFQQVIDFLNRSHICYALTKKPDVYISFIKQFWRYAEATTDDNGEVQITTTIDGHLNTITEVSLRRHPKLDDHDGITSIPNSEIFEQLALMGYHTDSNKLTFQKGAFSPQWRFLIHTILHCLSPKKTA